MTFAQSPAEPTDLTGGDVVVVGAGPAGSAAAAWAARAGRDVLLLDSAHFPRDKTCGDGLTPRAMAELQALGLADWAAGHVINRGLRVCGFGHQGLIPWPGGSLPNYGSAVARSELDNELRCTAARFGARLAEGKVVDVRRQGGAVRAVVVQTAEGVRDIACRTMIVADGARSPVGRLLGRTWHRQFAYGVAARAYVTSPRSDEQWITSHLELRDAQGQLVPGYGWIFPLGNGECNVGVGSLATARRPSTLALKPLLHHYISQRRGQWRFEGGARAMASALLPMGGAVSNISGPNWALVGDAAGCVNPLNGEGIDYGLEGGRLLATLLDEPDLTQAWPRLLRDHYGRTFSVARRVAALATHPHAVSRGGPPLLGSNLLCRIAVRIMGNLVTDEDSDLTARIWRTAGRLSLRRDELPPFT